MAPGAPRGKRKVVRGGGKNFSRNLQPLDDKDMQPREQPKPDDAESDAESGSEEDSEGEGGGAGPQLTRAERKAAERARKEAARARLAGQAPASDDDDDDAEEENAPVVVPKAANKLAQGVAGIKISNPNDPANAGSSGLSRREREAIEAAAAKERYWKLQEQGKTDQAKADLARLAKIRAEREEKAKARKDELEEKKKEAEAKADARVGGKRR